MVSRRGRDPTVTSAALEASRGRALVTWLPVVMVFLVVLVTHNRSPVITSFDSRWSIYTAMSLVREGDVDLDEYGALLAADGHVGIEPVGGRRLAFYPIGPSLLAVPFVFAIDHLDRWRGLGDLDRRLREDPGLHGRLERLVASVLVAGAATGLFLAVRVATARTAVALLLAGIFAYGTSAWSTASRALWQHGPSMLLLTVALLLILGARTRPAWSQYVAVPLALSFVVRPTNGVAVTLLSLLVLARHRAWAWRYVAWGATVAVPFVAYSWNVYGHILPSYYRPARLGAEGTFLQALAGNLVSPARGLFVFSPVLLFAVWGVARAGPAAWDWTLAWVLGGIVAAHWLVISSFPHWWGGHSYGPRLFSDVVPYLVYLLVPAVTALAALGGRRRAALSGLFALAVAASVFAHYRGAASQHADQWNSRPVDVDRAPARVWDWRDLQFLRGVRL